MAQQLPVALVCRVLGAPAPASTPAVPQPVPGAVQLGALPGENVLAGHYTGYASDIEVSGGRWTWVRLEPASLTGVDLAQAWLRDPQDLAELLDAHSQPYSPPLPLAAIVEEVPET